MKKYKVKNVFVEAQQYKKGMEDGFNSYAIMGNFCGYFPKREDQCYPRNKLVPVVISDGEKVEVANDDWIVMIMGEKYVYKNKDFSDYFDEITE